MLRTIPTTLTPHPIRIALALAIALTIHSSNHAAAPEPTPFEVGLARVDVTPDTPIRLSGFASRMTESVGVREPIFARAMAIRPVAGGEPVVVVTVDSLCIPAYLRDEVAHRLAEKKHVANDRFAVCSTHSHTAPMVTNTLPTLFGRPIPPEELARIDRYTKKLTDGIEQAAVDALDHLQPARLAFGIGNVGFAINRRTRGGPVDHDLPLLAVFDAAGKVRGIWVNYACHCVVLSDFQVSGDWAGYAAKAIEAKYPGSIALLSVGCGADSNPQSGVVGDKGEVAQQYGNEVATEVARLADSTLKPVNGPIECHFDTITLPLQTLPTRDEWAKRAEKQDAVGYHARVQLAKLDAGEKLPTSVAYPIQTWKFGDSLATVFLSGEVVADYSKRLKKEFDASRLWLNAYTNDDPAYIPSERILKEGGYEGGGAMTYYNLPAPFAPGLEDKIIATVSQQLGDKFRAPTPPNKAGEKEQPAKPAGGQGTQGHLPKSPAESLAAIQVHDGLRVELVASEPMVQSPVAIDFGPDGKLWVAEMRDYGCRDGETCPPNGRVSVLEDRDGDGTFETATVFLDKIAEPMGVAVWRKGVLISAAPDLIYAEDTDGDGKADVVKKLLTGFSVENPQARLNLLSPDLDGSLVAGCMFVGKVRRPDGSEIDVGNHDFRLDPDHLTIEPENGQTENARVRDDFGNWFGCENSNLCLHYPLPERYLRRNPHVLPPRLAVNVPDAAAAKLLPRGEIMLMPLSGPAGRATAACGLTVYRDTLLGDQFYGNIFTCEPVSQLVHRQVLEPHGATFVGHRAAEEQESEFLSSTDNWFRPVQVRTGPDGTLWVVDMYRYVVEHSRWIPPEVLKDLDLYAGSDRGRIYRLLPKDAKHTPLPRIDKLNAQQLASALDTSNGTLRDMIQQQLAWNRATEAAPTLATLARESKRPAVRAQALWTLALLSQLDDELVARALADADPGVRRQAVRLAEPRIGKSLKLYSAVLKLVADADPHVALQLTCSLGEAGDPQKVAALATILQAHGGDPYVRTAALTSAVDDELPPLIEKLAAAADVRSDVWCSLLELAGASGSRAAFAAAVPIAAKCFQQDSGHASEACLAPLAALLAGLQRNSQKADLLTPPTAISLKALAQNCLHLASDDNSEVTLRVKAIEIVGKMPAELRLNTVVLQELLDAGNNAKLQTTAIDALAAQRTTNFADTLLSRWHTFTPALRTHVLDVLLSRKEWVAPLLAAVEQKTISANEIDATHRGRLVEYPDAALKQRAVASLAQAAMGTRAAIVSRYEPLLTKGNGDRGKAVFQKNCAVCHKVHGVGVQVGPDIAAREDKSSAGMLREILDPNRAVDQRFAEYVAVTADGIVKNGILVEENGAAITLRGQNAQESKLLRSELESLNSTGKSLMPEGFENQISPEELSDLLAFLASP